MLEIFFFVSSHATWDNEPVGAIQPLEVYRRIIARCICYQPCSARTTALGFNWFHCLVGLHWAFFFGLWFLVESHFRDIIGFILSWSKCVRKSIKLYNPKSRIVEFKTLSNSFERIVWSRICRCGLLLSFCCQDVYTFSSIRFDIQISRAKGITYPYTTPYIYI